VPDVTALLILLAAAFMAVTLLAHLVSVLLLPQLAPADAAHRLFSELEPHRFAIVAAASLPEDAAYPFADPATIVFVCRFDLDDGTVLARFGTTDALVGLSIVADDGRFAYSLGDRSAIRGQLDVRLATSAQLERLEANDPDGEAIQELRLRMQARRGAIILRAFVPRPSERANIEAQFGAATCELQALPQ
jgi:uncharacterized membrane protein